MSDYQPAAVPGPHFIKTY